jgi:hypothetical protein
MSFRMAGEGHLTCSMCRVFLQIQNQRFPVYNLNVPGDVKGSKRVISSDHYALMTTLVSLLSR